MRLWCRAVCVASVVLVIAVVVACVIRHQHATTALRAVYSYSAALPRVGDWAVFEVEVPKPGDYGVPPDGQMHHDYRVLKLRVVCRAVDGQHCHFDVLYVRDDKPAELAYFVDVDYSTNDLDKRTAVKDLRGKRVRLTDLIDGNPVPFDSFLAFDRAYLGRYASKKVKLEMDGECYIDRLNGSNDDIWRTEMSVTRGEKSVLSRHQTWKCGEWIWAESMGSGPGRMWYARRIAVSNATAQSE